MKQDTNVQALVRSVRVREMQKAGIVLRGDVTISAKHNIRQFAAHVAINSSLSNSKSRLC